MKVATWHGGTRFTVDRVPEPAPGPGEVIVRVDYNLSDREIAIRGAFGRGSAFFARALALLPSLDLPPLIATRFPLDRVPEAMAAANGRGLETAIAPCTP